MSRNLILAAGVALINGGLSGLIYYIPYFHLGGAMIQVGATNEISFSAIILPIMILSLSVLFAGIVLIIEGTKKS